MFHQFAVVHPPGIFDIEPFTLIPTVAVFDGSVRVDRD